MQSTETPLFESRPGAKSLWRAQRVYSDRIELDFFPVGTIRIPLDDVKSVAVRPPMVICDLIRGDYGIRDLLRTVKLDFADLNEHVAIEKDTGLWRQFRVTPEDPAAFAAAVEQARAARSESETR